VPGTILHTLLLSRLGTDVVSGCACRAWISQMNRWGPDRCRDNLIKIVNALLAEAKRREWKLDGKPILSRIAKYGTTLPGGIIFARSWARKLVLEAIKRSEQSEEPDLGVWPADRS